MSNENKALLTMIPSMTTACFLAIQGWISLPATPRVRWFGGALAIYFIWLWTDWLVGSERKRRPVRSC